MKNPFIGGRTEAITRGVGWRGECSIARTLAEELPSSSCTRKNTELRCDSGCGKEGFRLSGPRRLVCTAWPWLTERSSWYGFVWLASRQRE